MMKRLKTVLPAIALTLISGSVAAEQRNVCEERDTADHPMFRSTLASINHDYTPRKIDNKNVLFYKVQERYEGFGRVRLELDFTGNGSGKITNSPAPVFNKFVCHRFEIDSVAYARIAGKAENNKINIALGRRAYEKDTRECQVMPVSHAFAEVAENGNVIVQFKIKETEEMKASRSKAEPADCYTVQFATPGYMKPEGLNYNR